MAHTVDVDGMLDSMTHEQFNEWHAKDLIEPIGHSGTHMILSRIGVLLASYMGSEDITEETFMFWKQSQQKTSDEAAAIAALESVGARRT